MEVLRLSMIRSMINMEISFSLISWSLRANRDDSLFM